MKILLLCFCLFCLAGFAQKRKEKNPFDKRSHFSLGITAGYKSDGGSFAMQLAYLVKKRVDVNVHVGANWYEGAAVGGGLKLMLLKDKKIVPYIGLTYDKFFSSNTLFNMRGDTVYSSYARGKSDIILIQPGVLYQEEGFSFFISLNYKYPIRKNHLVFKSGSRDLSTEYAANRAYSAGPGCTVGIIFHMWCRK
jgi:hypothetical protein